jgi:hypothetical protein
MSLSALVSKELEVVLRHAQGEMRMADLRGSEISREGIEE